MVDSLWHRERSKKSVDIRAAFANAYNNLLRARLKEGKSLHGIKLRAAAMAGFGAGSWCPSVAYKVQRTKASLMMKDPEVQKKLRELGLEPHPFIKNEWQVKNGKEGK
jgi:hypothetical protein